MSGPYTYWRRANYVLMAMVLVAMAGAIGLVMATLAVVGTAAEEPAVARLAVWLGAMAGLLVILVLFGLGVLVIRYLGVRASDRRATSPPTEVVDAWKLAGERAQVPEDLEDTEQPTDWKDPEDWDDRPPRR